MAGPGPGSAGRVEPAGDRERPVKRYRRSDLDDEEQKNKLLVEADEEEDG